MELNGEHEGFFDVIIVGGGPSGLHTASFLADSGLSVALFGKNTEIGEFICEKGDFRLNRECRYVITVL